jgi:hypothetical protein
LIILAQSYPHVKNVLYLIDRYINDATEIKLLVFQNRYLFDFFNEINNEHLNNQIEINFIPKYSAAYKNKLFQHLLVMEKLFLLSKIIVVILLIKKFIFLVNHSQVMDTIF